MYWTTKPASASEMFFREVAAAFLRDLLTEDRMAVESAQRGLSSGAIDQIQLQDHEILLRHLHEQVTARVQAYVAESDARGVPA